MGIDVVDGYLLNVIKNRKESGEDLIISGGKYCFRNVGFHRHLQFFLGKHADALYDKTGCIGQSVKIADPIEALIRKIPFGTTEEISVLIDKASDEIENYQHVSLELEKSVVIKAAKTGVENSSHPDIVQALVLTQEAYEMGCIGGFRPMLSFFPVMASITPKWFTVGFLESLPPNMTWDAKACMMESFEALFSPSSKQELKVAFVKQIARDVLSMMIRAESEAVMNDVLRIMAVKEASVLRLSGTRFETAMTTSLVAVKEDYVSLDKLRQKHTS